MSDTYYPTHLSADVTDGLVGYHSPKPTMMDDNLVWVAVMKDGTVWLYYTDEHAAETGEAAVMLFGYCPTCATEHGMMPGLFAAAHD